MDKSQNVEESISSEEGNMISSKFDYNLESERYRLPEYDILKKMAIEK